MKITGGTIVTSMALAVFVSVFACVIAVVLVRRMRRMLTQETFPLEGSSSLDELPLRTYNAVIQELKQQKHELLTEQQEERRRAKTSENISAAVLSNLLSGVLFLNLHGLIKKANRSAKNILGFASLAGMSAPEVFREAFVMGSGKNLAAAIQASLRDQRSRTLQAEYVTPAGEKRVLDLTITSVCSASGEIMGAACLINDNTEMALIQEQEELRGEVSAEMALELRASLAAISDYARKLAASRDPETARRLAADIASEASQLEHKIGGFLAGARVAKAAAGA